MFDEKDFDHDFVEELVECRMLSMKKNVEGVVKNGKESVVMAEEDDNEEKADDDVMCI